MKRFILAALTCVGILSTGTAHADPWCSNPYTCNPNPSWPGQLQETWNIPGIYGGWTNDPIYCNPMVPGGQCGIYAPNPNG